MKKTKCHTCDGNGEIEVCTVCANPVENCDCEEDFAPTENETCPDCDGDGEVEEENEDD